MMINSSIKNVKILLIIIIVFTIINSVFANKHGKDVIYRINSGSIESYTDNNGNVWAADQGFSESKTVTREKLLIIHNTTSPEIYRFERYGMERYLLPVEPGTYTIRLHFAETFDCNFQEGSRSIGVSINGKTIIEQFDPYTESGGFAIPVIIEYAGCIATDKIEFVKGSAINAIEIFEISEETKESIQQIKPIVKKDDIFIGEKQKTIANVEKLKILFIGNSMTFYWAIPESFESLRRY